jgi:hypothetical protein
METIWLTLVQFQSKQWEMMRLLLLIFESTPLVKRPAKSRSIRLSGPTSRTESVYCVMAQGFVGRRGSNAWRLLLAVTIGELQ